MRIAAVVVTYNRLNLLKECIQALRVQTYPLDKIIVINNSSTDGTLEWLKAQTDLDILTQENSGSAGGQYTGIKKAYEEGFDWIWCMDDDGLADIDALKNLVFASQQYYNGNEIFGSMVIDKNNHNLLSFKLPLKKYYIKLLDIHLKYTEKVSDINSYCDEKKSNLYPGGLYFNAVLFSHSIINKIGLPNYELFIWGDETEFYHRSKFYNIKNFIVSNSIFFHPAPDVNKKIANWKMKYYTRNWVYIVIKYRNLKFLRLTYLFFKIIITFKWYLIPPFFQGLNKKFINKYHLQNN